MKQASPTTIIRRGHWITSLLFPLKTSMRIFILLKLPMEVGCNLVDRFISFAYFCHPDESDVSHPQRPKPPAEGVGGRDLHGEMPHAVFDGLACRVVDFGFRRDDK